MFGNEDLFCFLLSLKRKIFVFLVPSHVTQDEKRKKIYEHKKHITSRTTRVEQIIQDADLNDDDCVHDIQMYDSKHRKGERCELGWVFLRD